MEKKIIEQIKVIKDMVYYGFCLVLVAIFMFKCDGILQEFLLFLFLVVLTIFGVVHATNKRL